ncbi:MAG: hypothetical protein A3F84_28790 [Candidatus Handelsmanbacteria bacterium RIFCSPLOWO2_12_FULL_64_10]|uniref:Fis family transcriptional regulator n=1 Tax=Handelsmanbacteria sp. (strain RIFCSPLOWO2_12_FULL_64_10) TaxID=1817868 RepID=A0A1F6C6D4_HANXR|nr:MAG: hypothetical protein A3F84_28790 [Candidatus Handelsmanbacteria bacterium RIFCSPLOWO2_12_FULL_64_10]
MSILLIDDEPSILRSVGNYLRDRGHHLFVAERGEEGLEILRREAVDIVITDFRMPGMDGFEVLREARRISPGTEVIVITAYGDIESAVRAMREGAFDFFTKPFEMQALHAALRRTVRFHALRQEKDRYRERLERLDAEVRGRYGPSAIVGESAAIQKVRTLIEQVCQAEATTVLVCGETGTGKELVAQAIHYGSGRAGGPFVAVDCSAIPETLLESEFYGHVKGAFTDARESRKGHFELADGGTLFLDEVGDMGLAMQAKLLRTLEERRVRPVGGSRDIPVDVRVISATNRDLPGAISAGRFRGDLYYRLNAFTIQAPPLRERPEDIPLLAEHFLARYARELRKPIAGWTPEATALLKTHPFPGNVRELRNLVERAAILCRTDRVTPEDLEFAPAPEAVLTPSEEVSGATSARAVGLAGFVRGASAADLNLSAAEKEFIQEALRRSGGSQVQAARLLGISRDALRRRMIQHDVQNPE